MESPAISVTFTVYFDGQFWVGVAERTEDGVLSAAKVVFGAEPSDEEILRFVLERWNGLSFSPGIASTQKKRIRNPKRRQRESAKEAAAAKPSTKAQQALAEMRELNKAEAQRRSAETKREANAARFARRREKRRRKHQGH